MDIGSYLLTFLLGEKFMILSTEVQKIHEQRRKLADERHAVTHKFNINGHKGYFTVGVYEDGTPGEIFIVIAKEGSTISGVLDGFATAISIALQYGAPLGVLADKFIDVRYEPSGYTKNPEIPFAKSFSDYIFRWLILKFGTEEEKAAIKANPVRVLPFVSSLSEEEE